MRRPRVLIADDHPLVLDGIRKAIEPEVDIVGTAKDGRELISAAHLLKPDIILLDISMPLLNGVEAGRLLRKTQPGAKLIFLTMHADPTYVAEALRMGASGFVLKFSDTRELIEAIRAVARERTYVTPRAAPHSDMPLTNESILTLTSRQREVLQLMAEGLCPKEISSLMGISVRTVEFHRYSIMQRLRLRTTAELTKYAVRHGITES